MHCDRSNDGPSAIVALGDFSGGQLWTADRGVLPCRREVRLFNGNQPHCTLPFKGERYSLIYFSSSGHDRMARAPRGGRGDAAAETRRVRGRVAATPRLRLGASSAAESRRRRGSGSDL